MSMAKWTDVLTSTWTLGPPLCAISGRMGKTSKKNWWTNWRNPAWSASRLWMKTEATPATSSGRNWSRTWTGAGSTTASTPWWCRASSRVCPHSSWKCHSPCAALLYGTPIFWKSKSNWLESFNKGLYANNGEKITVRRVWNRIRVLLKI